MKPIRLLTGLLFMFVALWPSAQAADLLLGLRSKNVEDVYQYRTIWVSGPKIRVQIGNDLVVPQGNGFDRIRVFPQDLPVKASETEGRKASGADAIEWLTREDRLVKKTLPAGPETWLPSINDPASPARCDGAIWRKVLFVGPRYLGLEESQAGYCGGANHPFQSSILRVYDVQQFSQPRPLPITRVLGEDAAEAFFQRAGTTLKRLPVTRQQKYQPRPDPANWGLVRRKGQWVARGRLQAKPGNPRDEAYGFDVGYPVSAGLTRSGRVTWKMVARHVRDAQDAFMSPDGQFLVVLTRTRLLGYQPRLGFRQIFQLPLRPAESAVMAIWAMPKNRSQWYAILPDALKARE